MCAGALANEEWSGTSLTIYGSRDPDTVYEKRMDNETLTAYWVKLGTEAGSARLLMNDSTFTLSNIFYLGTEADPGYTDLTATLVMTNSTLTCTTPPCGDVGRMDGKSGRKLHLCRDVATFGLHHPVPLGKNQPEFNLSCFSRQ